MGEVAIRGLLPSIQIILISIGTRLLVTVPMVQEIQCISSLLVIKQWVYDTQKSDTLKGEYTINIPISMNLIGCATSGTGDDATNIVGWSTNSITVRTFQSHKTDTTYQVRRPFHAILIGKN